MSSAKQSFFGKVTLIAATAMVLAPIGTWAQAPTDKASSATTTTSAKADRWLHVRVISTDGKGETVRVNVPLELAERVLPAVNHDRLHNGKVKIDCAQMNDVDLHALVDAIHSSKDGEYVTVQGSDNDVRVAKQGGYLLVHVLDHSYRGKHGIKDKDEAAEKSAGGKNTEKNEVEVKVPMKVIDALFSAGKDELDLVAALHALSAAGDTELVSVKDRDNTVRVWLDSKNVTD
jgi:hypothetical protein